MTVINLTPHWVLVRKDDYDWVFEPSGIVARREEIREYDNDYVWVEYPDDSTTNEARPMCEALPICHVTYGDITELPPPESGTVYIVSALVAQGAPERTDLLVPDDMFRGAEGHIVGSRGFLRISTENEEHRARRLAAQQKILHLQTADLHALSLTQLEEILAIVEPPAEGASE